MSHALCVYQMRILSGCGVRFDANFRDSAWFLLFVSVYAFFSHTLTVLILEINYMRSQGKSSTWCRNAVRYDEMKDIENLWLRHQAEFLYLFIFPSLHPDLPKFQREGVFVYFSQLLFCNKISRFWYLLLFASGYGP